MNPIFTADDPAFAEHLQAVTTAVTRAMRSGDVTDVLSLHVSCDQHTRISPWLAGAPLTALLRWAARLTDPSWTAVAHPPITADSGPLVSVYVVGYLDGLPVELVGSSYRQLPIDYTDHGRQQPLDVEAVRELAEREHAIDLTPEPAP